MSMLLPVTLATTSTLALIYFVLSVRVVRGRFKLRVSMGDGGNDDLQTRIRIHGNFAEYVPLLLIFLALFELAGVDKFVLGIGGVVLVVARLLHAFGMPRRPPNFYRVAGTALTFALYIVASVYGAFLALGY